MLGMIFTALLMSSANSLAWSNGNNVIGESTAGKYRVGVNPIPLYKEDYTKSITVNTMRDCYGTHDWIAESALVLLNSVRSSNTFLTKLMDINDPDDLRIWFLFGTEMPDHFTCPPLKTRCRYPLKLTDFHGGKHNRLFFYETGLAMPREDSAARCASALYQEIKIAFQKNDCQRAAILMGALMHVIADATFFYHVIEGASRAPEFESHVDHVTFKTWNDGDRNLDNPTKEFFRLKEARDKLTTITMDPYLATIYAGIDTYYGSSGFEDALWLLANAPLSISRHYWAWVEGYWNSYDQQHTWTYSMRPTSGDAKIYFDTVEHNLNMAVYYCAVALNYVITYGGYTDCSCSGEYPGEQNPYPPESEGIQNKEGIKVAVDEFQSLFFLGAVGLASTMISLTLVNKMWGIIEKMIPVW